MPFPQPRHRFDKGYSKMYSPTVEKSYLELPSSARKLQGKPVSRSSDTAKPLPVSAALPCAQPCRSGSDSSMPTAGFVQLRNTTQPKPLPAETLAGSLARDRPSCASCLQSKASRLQLQGQHSGACCMTPMKEKSMPAGRSSPSRPASIWVKGRFLQVAFAASQSAVIAGACSSGSGWSSGSKPHSDRADHTQQEENSPFETSLSSWTSNSRALPDSRAQRPALLAASRRIQVQLP